MEVCPEKKLFLLSFFCLNSADAFFPYRYGLGLCTKTFVRFVIPRVRNRLSAHKREKAKTILTFQSESDIVTRIIESENIT